MCTWSVMTGFVEHLCTRSEKSQILFWATSFQSRETREWSKWWSFLLRQSWPKSGTYRLYGTVCDRRMSALIGSSSHSEVDPPMNSRHWWWWPKRTKRPRSEVKLKAETGTEKQGQQYDDRLTCLAQPQKQWETVREWITGRYENLTSGLIMQKNSLSGLTFARAS